MNLHGLLSGAAWSTVARVAQLLVTLLTLACIGRFAGPEAFGLFSLVWVVFGLPEQLVFSSINDSTIGQRDVSRRQYDSLLWASCAVLFVVAALVALNASMLAHWLGGGPVLASLLVWRAFMLPLTAFIGTSQAMLVREGRFKRLANVDMTANMLSAILGIGLAASGFGVWSLLVMELTRLGLQCAGQMYSAQWLPRLTFSAREVSSLAPAGLHAAGSTLADYLVRMTPRLLIGQMLGSQALGLYAMAERLCEQVSRILVLPGYDIVKSSASRARTDLAALRQLLAGAVQTSSLLAYPVLLGGAAVAPVLLPWVLGEQWAAAVAVLQLLMIAKLRAPLSAFGAAVFIGTGRADRHNHLRWTQLGLTVALCWMAAPLGLWAVGLALLVRNGLLGAVESMMLRAHIQMPVHHQIAGGLRHGAASLLMVAVVHGWLFASANWLSPVLSLFVAVTLGVLAYLPALALCAPRSWVAIREVTLRLARGERGAVVAYFETVGARTSLAR